jgi:hypothetical protein
MEINERNRRAMLAREGLIRFPAGRTLKIAFGTPIPADLPPGTPIQCVPAAQADAVPQGSGQCPGHAVALPGSGVPCSFGPIETMERVREQNRRAMLSHDAQLTGNE